MYCVVSDVNFVSPNRFKKVKQGGAFIWQSFVVRGIIEVLLGDFFEIRNGMYKQGKSQWLINIYSLFIFFEAIISILIIKLSEFWNFKHRKKPD